MVSLTGAQNAAPLVQTILDLQRQISDLQTQASPGPIAIWKISIDAYIGTDKKSKTFIINHNISEADSLNIGVAILTALNSDLAAAQTSLTAIT